MMDDHFESIKFNVESFGAESLLEFDIEWMVAEIEFLKKQNEVMRDTIEGIYTVTDQGEVAEHITKTRKKLQEIEDEFTQKDETAPGE